MDITTLIGAAALAHACDLESSLLKHVAAIEKITGPLTFAEDLTIAQACAAHGPIIEALASARAATGLKPSALAVTVMIDGEVAFHLDEGDACVAPALGEEPTVVAGLAAALAFITAKPGPLAG